MRTQLSHPDNSQLNILASQIRFDGQRVPNRAAPLLGEESDAILGELNYDESAIAHLGKSGIV